MPQPRLALAHEWLDQPAGSEKTFLSMADAFPDADLFALSNDLDAAVLQGRTVRTTFVPRTPLLRSSRPLALPLMPLAWRLIDAGEYDLVITSSHACVKGFRPGRAATHLCYCYTPMRYVWEADDDRGGSQRLARFGPAAALRSWDRRSARWVDDFAAISLAVQERIEAHYGRSSRVIHPPVDTEFYRPGPVDDPALPFPAGQFVLACSRFIPYKRLDVAIETAARIGIPIVVAGSGPAEEQLRATAARARADAAFVGRPTDIDLRCLYRAAAAFIFPALEDFGIVAVEAQACGTPVVALDAGGSRDTVVDGATGRLVAGQDLDAFAVGLADLLASPADPAACTANASRFSTARFQAAIRAWVDEFG